MTRKGHEGTFWGESNVLFLARVYEHQGMPLSKLNECTLRFVQLILCNYFYHIYFILKSMSKYCTTANNMPSEVFRGTLVEICNLF